MDARQESDTLLSPGAGPYPSYGIEDSAEITNDGTSAVSRGSNADLLGSVRYAQSGKERFWSSALFCLIASFSSFITGVVLSFSSATVLELDSIYKDGDNVHGVSESSTYSSLFGSFVALGAVFGAPSAWPVSDKFGRKPALMFGAVFTFLGWLFIACANYVSGSHSGFLAVLLIGRLLTGYGGGWAVFCVSVYIAEVSSAKLKGLFGACNQFFSTMGQLVGYALGALAISFNGFAYYHVAFITAGFVILFELFMLFTRETPRWLFAHGKEMVGMRVLQILRGPRVDITKEVGGIKQSIEKTKGLSFRELVQAIKHRSAYIPFILALLIMFFQQFSGINIAIFYAGTILKQAGTGGSGPDAEKNATIYATISVGVVQVLITFVAVVLVDYLGRRVLLVSSSIGSLVSTFLLGIHFFIVDHKCHGCLGTNCTDDNNITHANDFSPCDSTNLGWLAIVSLALFIAAFSIGWGPVPWLAMSELLPLRLRGLLGSIVTTWNWLCAFIITESFQDYKNAVSPAFTWWSFSIVMVVSIFFVILFLPETKGHSLEEIEENFEQGHILAVSCKCARRDREENSGYMNIQDE